MRQASKVDPIRTHREGTALYDSGNYKDAIDKFLQASQLRVRRTGPELTKKQRSIIQKVVESLKDEFSKREIESITFGFPQLVSVNIKKKKEGKKS